MAEQEQEVMELEETGGAQDVPVEGSQPDIGPSGEAGKEAASDKPAGQQAPAQPSSPSWFKADQIKLKYRGQEVSPRDYNHAVQLMQQGYSYSQAMAQVNQMRQQLESQKGKFSQYEKLEQAFQQNPAFAARIWSMYQEAMGGRGQQPGQQQVQPNTPQDPQYYQLMQMVQQMQGRLSQWDEAKADESVEREIQDLRSKFTTVQWDATTETGHTLLYDVLNHAHQHRFPNLLAAARDYLWESQVANAKMAGAQQTAQQRQRNAKAGIVGSGAAAPAGASKGGVNLRESSYEDLTDMALRDLGLKK